MRPLLVIVGIVVVLLIAGLATGFINLSGQSGALPKVAVEGGKLPSVDADVGKIEVGTRNTAIEVPDVNVNVDTKKEKVEVPTIGVEKAK